MPINNLTEDGYGMLVGSGAASFTGLLDTYPNAAAAYSVRRLSGTYTGSAIEVRRSSDNTTQDIGFDANGDLDTTALLAFVGGGNGFVRTWYDQSGNSEDFIQTTASSHPKIITSGVINLESGKPVLTWDGVDDYFSTELTSPSTNAYHNIANYKAISVPIVGSTAIGSENSNDKRYWYRNVLDTRIRNGGATEASFNYLSANSIISIIYDGTTTVKVYEDGGSVQTGTVSGSSITQTIILGDWAATGRPMNMSLSEFIDWQDDDSTRQLGVHSNQNNYYSIY